MNYLDIFPKDLTNFVLVTLFSLLIGLSQRKRYMRREETPEFGSDRTFTLIGILGYILYILDPNNLSTFLCGGLAIVILLGINYVNKLIKQNSTGITAIMTSLITYCLGPLIYTQELWIPILIVVTILVLTEMKEKFINFTEKINDLEFINFAKFMAICGVVLPILPNDEIIKGINITPYNIWLSTVIISGFSYISYLLKKYVFKDAGIIVTGILGGIYSSTATCVILSKKSLDANESLYQYITAIFCAIAMMYIKFLILLGIFYSALLDEYWHIFIIMFFITAGVAFGMFKYYRSKTMPTEHIKDEDDKNPLEFKVALIFAALFILFTFITHYTIEYFGSEGLRTLSIFAGISDPAPFIINLLQGKYAITDTTIIIALFHALISNNIVKMCYGIGFSKRKIAKPLLIGFSIITISNIFLLIFLS
ncbi:MAG TPA: DUF4010 domain-containing protein [Paludibacteraceae bacterium]|nr:DUF4010 domain-containing protein [Paludibacteraceae bacterium]HOU68228.1 DUF4010 domain-containing protein [Paludibacteraceae bacterium]HPH63722.1 DUF4010 domain-containing protein [Paludibacteraceae bacterium]HQF50833.1 DUF4010 domain-containing protein [Paludibacteraceae bacterium]